MELLTAAMFAADASVTATVRLLRSAFCDNRLVVTPVATVTVHSDPAASVAVFAVRVRVASAVPEFVAAAVNAVLPHPADMVGTDGDVSVNVGSTRAMVSVVCSSGALSSNVYEIDVAVDVTGFATCKALADIAGTTVTVDVAIFTAAMSVTSPSRKVTAAVRELQFTTCAVLLVVTPVAMVTEHSSYALSTAVPAASVSVASASPVLAAVAVKTVLPHPLSAGDPSVPNWNAGSTKAMLSTGLPVSRGEFRAKLNVIDDRASVTGLAITSWLYWNAAVGATTAVDGEIELLAAAMSAADARVTATVRLVKSAACACLLVVTPVATVTVHSDPAASVAVFAVRVRVASAVSEFVAATVNAVLPHPADMVGTDGDAMANVGSTRAMVSVVCSSGALSSNVYEIEDSDQVSGTAMVSMLALSDGATVTGEVLIVSATMLSVLAKVTAAVRELQFTTCAVLLVVTPVAMVTEHSSYALSTAVPAASVNVASASPVLAAMAVKTVLPHPLSTGDPSVLAIPPAAVPEPNSANAFEPLPASTAMVLAAPVLDDVMRTFPLLADATAPVSAPLMAVTVSPTLCRSTVKERVWSLPSTVTIRFSLLAPLKSNAVNEPPM